MGDVRVDGPNSPPVKSSEEMIGRFQAELISALPGWKERVSSDPGRLAELERDVQQVFDRGAGLLIAGLIALVMKDPEFDQACERTRRGFDYPLAAGRMRQVRVLRTAQVLVWEIKGQGPRRVRRTGAVRFRQRLFSRRSEPGSPESGALSLTGCRPT